VESGVSSVRVVEMTSSCLDAAAERRPLQARTFNRPGAGSTMRPMPRYVIERFFSHISDDDMLAASVRSDQIAQERFPDITWEHSHVVIDDDGAIKTFCIYEAPSEEMIREHAAEFGAHEIYNLYELVDDVTPEEIRRRATAAQV